MSAFGIDPGQHRCGTPDVTGGVAYELRENKGAVWWRCPECRAKWEGKGDFGKIGGERDYYIVWTRLTNPSARWRRREIKRLAEMLPMTTRHGCQVCEREEG